MNLITDPSGYLRWRHSWSDLSNGRPVRRTLLSPIITQAYPKDLALKRFILTICRCSTRAQASLDRCLSRDIPLA